MVQFTGTTRDTSVGRSEVQLLTYEAYDSEVTRRMAAVVTEMRARWGDVERIAILHRSGAVPVGEASVHVGVSAPHRDAAFEAARFGIDAVKASVPIWKLERHSEGEDWGLDGSDIADASGVPSSWDNAAIRGRSGRGAVSSEPGA